MRRGRHRKLWESVGLCPCCALMCCVFLSSQCPTLPLPPPRYQRESEGSNPPCYQFLEEYTPLPHAPHPDSLPLPPFFYPAGLPLAPLLFPCTHFLFSPLPPPPPTWLSPDCLERLPSPRGCRGLRPRALGWNPGLMLTCWESADTSSPFSGLPFHFLFCFVVVVCACVE